MPVSLAEFTLDAGDGHTYYDISLVDGYNIPMAIVLQPLQNVSLDDIPPNLTNPSCQGTLGLLREKSYDPYSSGHERFLGTNSSYPLPFEREVDDNQVARWCPWDLQQEPPDKPGDGVYPYPDDNIERPAFNPCFSACAKNNKPEDCCTGEHNSPSACQPSKYSKSVKKVCPDAYSYGKSAPFSYTIFLPGIVHELMLCTIAFDDQTSTFIIPAGAGFEVVFCPGARSTNILATETEKLHQLAESGNVKKHQYQSTMSLKKMRDNLPRRSAAARSVHMDIPVLVASSLTMAGILWMVVW